jgi:hypothetical protein
MGYLGKKLLVDNRLRPSTPLLWACVLAIMLAILPAVGQERFGSLVGTARDASGAVLPDATITVTNTATGREATTTSRADGGFMVRELESGRYTVVVEKSGFSRFEAPDVLILVGRTTTVNATLEVGALTQTIEVSDAAVTVDTTSTLVAHNVTAEEFDMLPKTRGFQGMALMSPSVNTGVIESGYQINGASGAENSYLVDGISINSVIDGSARQEAVLEHLQEVQVKTGGLEAEYGGALGGVVSAITKSGGNDFHGSIHYYYYGSKFNAQPVKRLNLDPADQMTVRYIQDSEDRTSWHDFGGSLGGPIVPNKLFFYTSFAPRWQRSERDYLFDNGQTPDTMKRKANYMSWFNKISFDPTSRLRTNFTWLYTPTVLTGSHPAYNGAAPNVSATPYTTAQSYKNLGYFQPEQSYTGQVDYAISNTGLVSVKAGRYYLNYKDTGTPTATLVRWASSSVGMENLPSELRQPTNYGTPSPGRVLYDITTRSYVQADYAQFVNFGGQHNFKFGIGDQKNVNKLVDSWYGPEGYVQLFWGTPWTDGRMGTYGYYAVHDGYSGGSTGGNIFHLYFQDSWRIHPRLTLNIGLRTERETIPSFQRDVKDYAFRFGFGDKLAPRLGASFDLFGDGRAKIYASWGRYFDWTKYDLARGTFGADVWHTYYRTLDTLDVFNLGLSNLPGQNLWVSEYRNWRTPGFEYLDPNVKPMSTEMTNVGFEYELKPGTVLALHYVHNSLVRTIEDFGALDENGDEVYRYGNPGEGMYEYGPVSGATCDKEINGVCTYRMPKPKRVYDAFEASITRRFRGGWLANASYVVSRLWGNYAGLQSTDEVLPFDTAYSSNQSFFGSTARPGSNANRYYDLDEASYDANGKYIEGRLPTDRPHVFKFYGAKLFSFGTEIGGFFRVSSGTPVTTQVTSVNDIPIYVNGRGDMGRTPVFSQTDLVVAHEVKMGESKRLRFQFEMFNLFNQKTAQYIGDRYNREDRYSSSGIDLSGVDLSKGYDWRALLAEVPDGAFALDPRFGKETLFNRGFNGRFMVKFTF